MLNIIELNYLFLIFAWPNEIFIWSKIWLNEIETRLIIEISKGI